MRPESSRRSIVARVAGPVLWLCAWIPFSLSAAPAAEPLWISPAATVDAPGFHFQAVDFSDVTLKQVENFDGWSARAGLVWPLDDRRQVRVVWPFYTSGEARITDIVDEKIDLIGSQTHIRGSGGVFEFLTATYEKQTQVEDEDGRNRAWFFGLGSRPDYLDTTHEDRFNHQGKLLRYGVRCDRAFGDSGRWYRQLGLTWYFKSDDLNPSGGHDNFIHVDAVGALAWGGWRDRLFPVIEAGYRGDLSDYHDAFVAPELSLRLGEKTYLTLAVQVGLTGDAPGPNYLLRIAR